MNLQPGTYTFASGDFSVELALRPRHIREATREARHACGEPGPFPQYAGRHVLRPYVRISVGDVQIVGDKPWPGRRKPGRHGIFGLARNLHAIAWRADLPRNKTSSPDMLFHRVDRAVLLEVSGGARLCRVPIDDLRQVADQIAAWSRSALDAVFPRLSRPAHIEAWIRDGVGPREMESPIGTMKDYDGLVWEYRYGWDLTQIMVTREQQEALRAAWVEQRERWPYWLVGDVILGQLGNTLVFYASLPRFCEFLREIERRHAAREQNFDFAMSPRTTLHARLRGRLVWVELNGEQFWSTRKYLRLLRRGLALDTIALLRRLVPEHDWSEMERRLLDGLDVSWAE